MEFSPLFGSFTPQSQIGNFTSTADSAEQELASFEKQALEEGGHLPKHKQDLYKAMVRQSINQIRGQISAMRSRGKTDYEISRAVKVLVQDFKASNDNFIQYNQIWNSAKDEVRNNFYHTNIKLSNLDSGFGKIKRIQFDDEDLNEQPAIDMEKKKSEFAGCMQMVDPEYALGAEKCYSTLSKDMTDAQKKELNDFIPRAITGQAIDGLASLPAVTSKVISALVGTVSKTLFWIGADSAASENPVTYFKTMKETAKVVEGQDPEFNKLVKEKTPAWIMSTAKTIKNWDEQLSELDKHMQDKYRTIPGIVHDGIFGTAELGLMAATAPLVKGTVYMAKGITQIAGSSSQLIRGSFPTFSNAPSFYLDLLKASKTPQLLRHCKKNECAGKFIRDMKEFSSLPNMISEKTKKELVLVQYHGSGEVGVDRTLNWWMVPTEANYFHTLEEVMNKAGLLTSFGERNSVSVARIPKGEKLTFLLGKAGKQIDAITGEIRLGGATQLRIKDFKAEWVRERRKLPNVEKLENIASLNPLTIVTKNHFQNRQITKRTKMIPEDIGISPLEYLKDKRPFFHSAYHLEGWMTLKKDVFNITLESIEVPKGRLSNWLTVMSNFKEIAKANQAKFLQFEAQIINKKLLQVMTKYYGEPSIVLKKRYHDLIEYQVFKIPL